MRVQLALRKNLRLCFARTLLAAALSAATVWSQMTSPRSNATPTNGTRVGTKAKPAQEQNKPPKPLSIDITWRGAGYGCADVFELVSTKLAGGEKFSAVLAYWEKGTTMLNFTSDTVPPVTWASVSRPASGPGTVKFSNEIPSIAVLMFCQTIQDRFFTGKVIQPRRCLGK